MCTGAPDVRMRLTLVFRRPLPLRGPGIAVREVVMKPDHQRIDHLLYVDKAVGGLPRIWSKGVAEMKRVGSLCSL
jgi:hypothetical protein